MCNFASNMVPSVYDTLRNYFYGNHILLKFKIYSSVIIHGNFTLLMFPIIKINFDEVNPAI